MIRNGKLNTRIWVPWNTSKHDNTSNEGCSIFSALYFAEKQCVLVMGMSELPIVYSIASWGIPCSQCLDHWKKIIDNYLISFVLERQKMLIPFC